MSQTPPIRRLPILAHNTPFPDVESAWGAADPVPGVLCAGADLSMERLVAAYSQGIFPWFSEGEPILWWSPDPRMVLQVADFKLHRSLKQTIKRFRADPTCEVRMDTAFADVIGACANTSRGLNNGTWIVPAMQAAYIRLHNAGFAHSVEIWVNGELVGGLYFTQIGRAMFGESMFSLKANASKIALAALVEWCVLQDITWIDCQQQTSHLASLGAKPISRQAFIQNVSKAIL